MRGADLRHVHLQLGVLADEHARRARVVEVDVREEQVPHVAELESALGQAGLQRGQADRGPAVLQRGPVLGLEQVGADHSLAAEVVQVERLWRHAADAMPPARLPRMEQLAAFLGVSALVIVTPG